MPDLLALYNEQTQKAAENEAVATTEEQPNPLIQEQQPQQNVQAPPQKGMLLETNFGTTPEERQASINTAMSNQNMGALSTINTRDRYDDPTTWSPEYTDRSFVEEFGNSIMRGVGNHLIKGTGDMLQVIGGMFDKDLITGNFMSRALQNAGEDFTNNFKQFLPEELQSENITWASMMNPKFWSTHVAEMIPQLAEFIFLSHGGSTAAKALAKGSLKGLPGAAKTALGRVVPNSGKGIIGALSTDIGLTATGEGLAGAVGGGIVGNVFSGMLNAAEVINQNKDLRNPETGELIFNDEELRDMATGTIKNNAMWLPLDMASWGMTFGGGWKAVKGLNPVAKGGKLWNTAQQSKIAGNMFAYQMSPVIKAVGRLAKVAGTEGIEEMYQESFEEWAKMKAVSKVSGEPMEYDNFFDFFSSKENEATKVLSFAVGALSAGAFNIKSIINQKADDNYRTFDRQKNLAEIINKQGTDKELEYQQFHIRQSIADLVIDEKYSKDDSVYNEMIQSFVDKGNITEEEKAMYDEMHQNFKEVKSKGERLNVKGLEALLHNNAVESYATSKLQEYENIAKQSIADIEANDVMSEREKAKKIADIEKGFMTQVQATSLLLLEAKQNQSNLILGKRATALTLEIKTDEFGNDYATGGLSTQDYNKYTKEGEKNPISFVELKKGDLKEGGTKLYNNILDKAKGLFNKGKELVDKGKGIIDDKLNKQDDTTDEINQEGTETGVQEDKVADSNISKEEYQDFIDNGKVSEKRLNDIAEKVRRKEDLSKEETAMFTDKTAEINEILENDSKQPVPGNVYDEFKQSGFVPDSVLEKIAEDVNNERKLDDRQEEIRKAYKNDILERIVKKTLGRKPKNQRKPNAIDNLSKNEIDEINKEFDVEIKRTDEGFDIETKYNGIVQTNHIAKVKEAIDAKIEEKLSIKEDGELSGKENEYMKEEAENKRPSEDIESVQDSKNKKAIDDFKIDQDKIDKGSKEIFLDKRTHSENSIKKWNISNYLSGAHFLTALKKFKNNPEQETISQNAIDNYLNQFTTYNLEGPSNLDKMMAVNHQLKRMFPNTNNPAQVIIVRNLFESIGSQGLGSSLGMTIYIDEKSWNQENVFMHEMAHIYYRLAQGEPEVQKLVNAALANKDLLAQTKKAYDDYTLYNVNMSDGWSEMTKGQLFQFWKSFNIDDSMLEQFLSDAIAGGDVKTIPLREQKYLIEEMFTAQLEGPLTAKFDKVFNTKDEVKRQADVKVFWGLMKKKGEIINSDNGVDRMLRQLFESEEVPSGDMKDFLLNTFKAVTKGVTFDSFGLDKRSQDHSQEYLDGVEAVANRIANQISNAQDDDSQFNDNDQYDDYDLDLEEDGTGFYQKDFSVQAKKATRILRRFGVVYNKTLRAKRLIETRDKKVNRSTAQIFNRDLFESVIYNLATEIPSAKEFIYNIENSSLKEVQAFNRYLDKIFPKTKLDLLKSMHYVLSNSVHINGIRNNINDDNEHKQVTSFSQRELNKVDDTLERMKYSFDDRNNGNTRWNNYVEAVNNIYRDDKMNKGDFKIVLEMLSPLGFRTDKVLEQGYVTFKGVNIPIETLISGFIKKGYLFNMKKDKQGNLLLDKKGNPQIAFMGNNQAQVYYGAARPIIEALVNTNRKFTPLSTVKNAEGNMEPVRITNNHLTKEISNMLEYLAPDEKGKKVSKDDFIKRFSHVNYLPEEERKKNYIHNQFLENIYDQYEKGILPTVSQYHGLEDESNNKGSLYKNSTGLEQGIEDFMTYLQTAIKPDLKGMNTTYLGNMGAFSDSPRKFFMNMKRINLNQVFDSKGNLLKNGEVLSSIYRMHQSAYGDLSRTEFAQEFKKAVNNTIDFINDNAEQIGSKELLFLQGQKKLPLTDQFYEDGKLKQSGIFTKEGKLNKNGERIVKEYAVNSIINGYNVADVFAPNIDGKEIAKRFKLNLSPIMSVKNPNFKIEPIFFADEIANNSMAGTDSGMYILKEDAELFQKLGKGVFEMNHGFKFLNASIEKDNPNFKGKTAYLKGYTTIVDETHPLYKLMRARKDKYLAYHEKTYGGKPSQDLSDGTHNHIVIAIPQSSDKSNFSPNKFTEKVKDENGNMILKYTEEGLKYTEQALAENINEAMKHYDKLYYSKRGKFIGISAYNFGPQQVMDKISKTSNTPVQMVNSIIVNASLNGRLDEAYEIQALISAQKQVNLQKTLDKIKESNIEAYKALIKEGLNLQDMDQAQRLIFEDGGSLAHPYINEILVNQLAKTLRRKGNKLETDGTYAQQKPDSGWRASAKENKSLKGYTRNADGSLRPGEIVLPKHMVDSKLVERRVLTHQSDWGKQAIKNAESGLGIKQKETFARLRKESELTADLMLLELGAIGLAKKQHQKAIELAMVKNGTDADTEAYKFIGKEYDENSVLVGYHVKGDTVIASRVPGSKPGDTGVFEVVGYDKGDGNQVMVSSEFNQIIGADNDGDALFIQTKSKNKDQQNWNKAFDKMVEYWLSPQMAEQILSPMEFETQTKKIIENIAEKFPTNKNYVMPFSPQQRMIDYNNTMVSKRNVGPVFNIHKITNMLSAVNTPTSRSIKIGNNTYDKFEDRLKGNDSRNQQSAILANIILDNAKHGFADALGLDEYNTPQTVLLINMGVSLEEVGMILNSPAAKLWSEFNRNNNSMYHDSLQKETIIKKIYDKLKIKRTESNSLKISLSNIHQNGQHQGAVIELLSYLSDMNSEIQKVSTIMGGHNKIHVNPLVLEQQLKELNDVLNGKIENQTLILPDKFKSNPDLQNYITVAKETLEHVKNINPIYHQATNGVLSNIAKKVGKDLTATQIEKISQDILKFNTSRLLRLNNKPKEYVENLLSKDPKNQESIYNKLNKYLETLRLNVSRNNNDINKSFTDIDNSILFKQAMSMSLRGNNLYVSANSSFTNDSFNKIEREQAQYEFEQLPPELQNDLILYDMVERGWKGPQSLAPFFGNAANQFINMASNETMQNKNKPLPEHILNELEKIIALRSIKESNNPFDKVYINNDSVSSESAIVDEIFKNKNIYNKISKGQPLYINVIKSVKGSRAKSRLLYELEPFTDEEVSQVATERSWSQKKQRTESIARKKMKLVPDTLSKTNSNIDLTTIEDKNGVPISVKDGPQRSKSLDYLVEASIIYEEAMKALRAKKGGSSAIAMDARENFYDATYTQKNPLNFEQYVKANEFKPHMSDAIRKNMYGTYLEEKAKANKLIQEGVLNGLDTKTEEQLLDMYNTFGERDVYAFAGIITPVVKQLAKRLANSQAELLKKNGVKQYGAEGQDVSLMKAYLMSGSTIPSNHPASQALTRMLEKEYKNFINEKKGYMQEMERLTDNLYKEVLGYGGKVGLSIQGIRNMANRIKDALFGNRADMYDRLYGNLVEKEEYINEQGTLVFNYKLKTEKEVQGLFDAGLIGKAQKEFYDFFRKTTDELMPKNLNEVKENYIPHTSMSKLEMLSTRGLLGLMVNSRHEDQAIYDVKMKVDGNLLNFKQIEDSFKINSARGSKNDINKILEYRKLKSKAKKLLKSGKNEDGSDILASSPFIETALGFGAINRFSNNRSIKSTELPSMDLNKALGDYIHSTLFVNGNKNFKGMEKLGPYIDGVLAWNEENNLPNMNKHIQTVWKDYFLRNRRQESILGSKADRVITGLTKLNLFYALGYQANANTGGLYAIGNILAGKYHNIKDLGGKAWLKGEARFWGLDKGFQGGFEGIMKRMKRNAKIMKELNFMEINVYDEVSMEKKHGLDAIFSDIALAPMIYSEKWIQNTHMLGLLTDEQLDQFDENGNYKINSRRIDPEELIRLEDQVKSSHGRGYQPTDQRGVQMYSWGNMMLQFSRFIPTMVHDRFAKEDVNIYGRETIGTMTAVGKMLRYVLNNPKDFVAYRNSLTDEQRNKLDAGLRGVAMSTIIGLASQTSETANDLFWDANYYWNYPKLSGKMIPSTVQSVNNLVGSVF